MSQAQRALALLSCTLIGVVCGTLYLYSAYGPQLATKLGYSGTDSSLIAFAGSIGVALSGVPASVLIDSKGLTVAVVIGALSICSGYIGLKDQYDKVYSNLPISITLSFLIGVGSTFINSATIKCCAVTFPNNRGIATSFPISAYGLSAFIYSFFGSLFYKNDTSGFLAFLGYSSLVVSAITLPFIYMADKASNHGHTSRTLHPTRSGTQSPSIELESLSTTGFPKQKHLSEDLIHKSFQNHTMTKFEVLKSLDFWKLSVIIGVFVGLGQLYIYTVGFMVTSLLHTSGVDTGAEQQYQVSIISVSNCAGRLLCGIFGDIIANSLHKSRTWVFLVPAITLLLVQILGFTIVDEGALWTLSILNGIGYGFTWSSTPQILIEYFGVHNFSFSWGVINLAPILPAYVFTHLFGSIYDSNLIVDEETKVKVCLKGVKCYDHTFELTTIAAVLSLILVLWIVIRPLFGPQKIRY